MEIKENTTTGARSAPVGRAPVFSLFSLVFLNDFIIINTPPVRGCLLLWLLEYTPGHLPYAAGG